MTILSNSSYTNHHAAFMSFCKTADEIVMASPFCYADFSAFADAILDIGSIRKVIFITTAKNEEIAGKIDSLYSFSKEMERIGVQWTLQIDNKLHGKVYIFKKCGQPIVGIISSANLTHNGMELNHEWGVQIDNVQLLEEMESKIVKDAPNVLSIEKLNEIKDRVITSCLLGYQKLKSVDVDIDDIVYAYQVAKATKIFIKPYGVSEKPIYDGDFSRDKKMYFSKRRPKAVRVGDILVVYAVGGRRIIGVYEVMSRPIKEIGGMKRWPWYVEAKCLTPNLSNHKWRYVCPSVTQIAYDYVARFDKSITHVGTKTLGALNFGSDKIWLDDNYGCYLLGKLMDMEREMSH